MPPAQDPKRVAEIAAKKLAAMGLKTRYSVKEGHLYTALLVTDPTFINPFNKKQIEKVVLRNEGHERLKTVFPDFMDGLPEFKFVAFNHSAQIQQKVADLLRSRIDQIKDLCQRMRSMGLKCEVRPDDMSVRMIVVSGANKVESVVALDGTIVISRIGKMKLQDPALRKRGVFKLGAFQSGIDLELELGQRAAAIAKHLESEGGGDVEEAAPPDESEFLTQDDSVLDEIYNTNGGGGGNVSLDWEAEEKKASPKPEIVADLDALDSPFEEEEPTPAPKPPAAKPAAPPAKTPRPKLPAEVGGYVYYHLGELVRRFGEDATLMVKGDMQISTALKVDGSPCLLTLRAVSRDAYKGKVQNKKGASRNIELAFPDSDLSAGELIEEMKRKGV